jgi:hypothetical protein
MLIRTMLGLRARASEHALELDRPHLPPWIGRITIRRLRVGDATCDLRVQWRGDRPSVDVLRTDGPLEVTVRE